LHALERQFAGGRALQQGHGQAPSQECELVALAGGAPTLLCDATAGTSVGDAQQLVREIQQFVAALDYQRVQQHEEQRVPARGFQPAQLLSGHPRPPRSARRGSPNGPTAGCISITSKRARIGATSAARSSRRCPASSRARGAACAGLSRRTLGRPSPKKRYSAFSDAGARFTFDAAAFFSTCG